MQNHSCGSSGLGCGSGFGGFLTGPVSLAMIHLKKCPLSRANNYNGELHTKSLYHGLVMACYTLQSLENAAQR